MTAPPPTAPRTRRRPGGLSGVAAAAWLVVALTVAGLLVLWPYGLRVSGGDAGQRVRGVVTALSRVTCQDAPDGGGPATVCLRLRVRLDEGPERGRQVVLQTGDEPGLHGGRGVVLVRAPDSVPFEDRYQYADIQRGRQLLGLLGVVAVALVALARRRGALTLAGLAGALLVLGAFVVPSLLAGHAALPVTVVGAAAVACLTLGLTGGPTRRTALALLGTAGGLVVLAGLSYAVVLLTGLTGSTGGNADAVQALLGGVLDLRGLLLAGVVLGAMGVLLDLAVSQVDLVAELRAADPALPRRQLQAAAAAAGRERALAGVTTLVLAYAGAALPLLVLFSTGGTSVPDGLTTEVVAQEGVRALAGALGLLAAVPLTTALACRATPAPAPAGQAARSPAQPASPLDEGRSQDDPHSWGPRAAEPDPPA